jgi:hypothetical protein
VSACLTHGAVGEAGRRALGAGLAGGAVAWAGRVLLGWGARCRWAGQVLVAGRLGLDAPGRVLGMQGGTVVLLAAVAQQGGKGEER